MSSVYKGEPAKPPLLSPKPKAVRGALKDPNKSTVVEKVWVIEEVVPTINKYVVRARTRVEALKKFQRRDTLKDDGIAELVAFVIQDYLGRVVAMHGPFPTEEYARRVAEEVTSELGVSPEGKAGG